MNYPSYNVLCGEFWNRIPIYLRYIAFRFTWAFRQTTSLLQTNLKPSLFFYLWYFIRLLIRSQHLKLNSISESIKGFEKEALMAAL